MRRWAYVDSPAILVSRLRPRYPRLPAGRGVDGALTLWVLVSQVGTVEDVRILRSSGELVLDRAALDALRGASYRPALRAGIPVPTWTQQNVVFRLE